MLHGMVEALCFIVAGHECNQRINAVLFTQCLAQRLQQQLCDAAVTRAFQYADPVQIRFDRAVEMGADQCGINAADNAHAVTCEQRNGIGKPRIMKALTNGGDIRVVNRLAEIGFFLPQLPLKCNDGFDVCFGITDNLHDNLLR